MAPKPVFILIRKVRQVANNILHIGSERELPLLGHFLGSCTEDRIAGNQPGCAKPLKAEQQPVLSIAIVQIGA